MPGLSFFIGKGGVGKTTLSAAFAVHEAQRAPRRKHILISTDPAHNLADLFGVKLGREPARIKTRGHLEVWQLHAESLFRKFLGPHREAVLKLIESGTLFTRADIEPLLDSTLPGMAEVAGLLAIEELLDSDEYDHIIVDTAPIGHTLRLFELPRAFAKFLDFLDVAGGRDQWLAQRFGRGRGVRQPFLEDWSRRVARIEGALSKEESALYLVTTPERFSLRQSVRSREALAKNNPGMLISSVILNRAVTERASCRRCTLRFRQTAAARKFLAQQFPDAELHLASDTSAIAGLRSLAAFAKHVFAGARLPANPRSTAGRPKLARHPWPRLKTPLSFTLGKGGVGKTTITAALAFNERKLTKHAVTVCSTDPAPSLDDVFRARVGSTPRPVLADKKLLAVEVDSVAEFRAWAEQMRAQIERAFTSETSGGVHVDLSFDREVFGALLDIVPPGVDEIFAIFKITELLEGKTARVIIDMAPTGHALELLRMPERILLWTRLVLKSLAAHRTLPLAQDVAVEIAELGQQVRRLLKLMQDPRQARLFVVTLPENIPVAETRRLLGELSAMRLATEAVIVNRVLPAARGCARCDSAARSQAALLKTLRREFRERKVLIAPDAGGEVSGREAIAGFTQTLWQSR